jgi:hypothetical protein
MKRPELNEIVLNETILGGGKPALNVTMSVGQWDELLQAAYDSGAILIELDRNERPIRAFRRVPS